MLSQQLFNIHQLIQQKAFIEALARLEKLLLNTTTNAQLYELKGICHIHLQQINEGIRNLSQSLFFNDEQPKLHAYLASIYKQYQQNDLALKHLQKAAHYQPSNYHYYRELGFIYNRLKQPQKALIAFEQALKLTPKDINTLIGKASSFSELGSIEQAIMLYNKVLVQEPKNYIALYNLALCYKKQANFSLAIEHFKKCLQLRNNQPVLYENIAALYVEQGNIQQSLNYIKQGLQLAPYDQALNRLMATLLWELKEENFLANYQQFSVGKMPLPLALDYFYQLIKSEQFSQAGTLLKDLFRFHGEISDTVIAESQLFYTQKQHQQAKHKLEYLQSSRSLNYAELDWLGRHCLALGDFKQASIIYQKLTQLDSRNQGYWCLYSSALRETNYDEYKALVDYEHLVHAIDIELPQGFNSIDEFNQALMEVLKQEHITKQQPLAQSLQGGTQTMGRLFNRDNSLLKTLQQAIEKAIESVTKQLQFEPTHPTKKYAQSLFDFTGAWSVWLKSSGYHHNHYHSLGWYSGVYYINLPDEHDLKSGAGYLKLGQPDINLPKAQQADYYVKPKTGQIVLFPSFLWHGTEPFESSQPRVTVAFDVAPKL